MSYSCSCTNVKRDIYQHVIPYTAVTSLALMLLVFGILGRLQVTHFQNISRLTSSCLMTGGSALIIAEGIILCIKSASQKEEPVVVAHQPLMETVHTPIQKLKPESPNIDEHELSQYAPFLPVGTYLNFIDKFGQNRYCFHKQKLEWVIYESEEPVRRREKHAKTSLKQIRAHLSSEKYTCDKNDYFAPPANHFYIHETNGRQYVVALKGDNVIIPQEPLHEFNGRKDRNQFKECTLADYWKTTYERFDPLKELPRSHSFGAMVELDKKPQDNTQNKLTRSQSGGSLSLSPSTPLTTGLQSGTENSPHTPPATGLHPQADADICDPQYFTS